MHSLLTYDLSVLFLLSASSSSIGDRCGYLYSLWILTGSYRYSLCNIALLQQPCPPPLCAGITSFSAVTASVSTNGGRVTEEPIVSMARMSIVAVSNATWWPNVKWYEQLGPSGGRRIQYILRLCLYVSVTLKYVCKIESITLNESEPRNDENITTFTSRNGIFQVGVGDIIIIVFSGIMCDYFVSNNSWL